MTTLGAGVLCLVVWVLTGAREAHAQGVRGWITTSVRYLELRPLRTDTVPRSDVTADADGRLRVDGLLVACGGDVCTALVPRGTEHALVSNHQVGFTAWAGLRGLSLTGLVLVRDQLDGAFRWPRSDDPLDLALGFVEWTRAPVRLRLGRQRTSSTLGFSSFDGLDATVVVTPFLRVQAFAGRSLARGLAEPRNQALRGLEDFVPDDQAWILGSSLRTTPAAGTTVEFRWQREAWTDGNHAISERAALDLSTLRLAPVRLSAAVDYDLGFRRVGKAHVSVDAPLGSAVRIRGRLRRYLPYFELSTVWGFFDPVPYHEVDLEGRWSSGDARSFWAGSAYRRYGDTETTVIRQPLERDALAVRAGATARLGARVGTTAEYRLEWGAGGYLHAGDAALGFDVRPGVTLDARGSVFQRIGEFRLGDALVVGGGLTGRAQLGAGLTLDAGVLRFRTVDRERDDPRFDGSQDRLWVSLRADLDWMRRP